MKLLKSALIALFGSAIFLPLPGTAAADLTVHSGGTLIVHTNVQVNDGTFSVEPGGALNIELGSKVSATNIVYSGTLTVSSNNLVLASGQAFQLFSAPAYSGAFLTVNLPALTPALTWTNKLLSNGSIEVKPFPTNVRFATLSYSGTQMISSGSGGVSNSAYLILTTTNLGSSVTNWVIASTNYFDANGNFSFTNAITAGIPRQFFLLQVP